MNGHWILYTMSHIPYKFGLFSHFSCLVFVCLFFSFIQFISNMRDGQVSGKYRIHFNRKRIPMDDKWNESVLAELNTGVQSIEKQVKSTNITCSLYDL